MAEICREFGQVSLDVDTRPVPFKQGTNRESMPEIVEARSLTTRTRSASRAANANLTTEGEEGLMNP
jgi:hypothetical protein